MGIAARTNTAQERLDFLELAFLGKKGCTLVDKSGKPRHSFLQLNISERRTLLKLGDALAIVLAIFIALRIWAWVAGEAFQGDFIWRNSWWFVILPLLWVILAEVNDFYNLRVSAKFDQSLWRLLQITAQLLVVYLVIFFVSPRDTLPRLFILYYSILAFVLILLWRVIFWMPVIRRVQFKRRVVIVGAGWAARTLVKALRDYAPGEYEVVGLIANFDPQDTLTHEVPLLGGGKRLLEVVERQHISEIILAYGSQLPGDVFQGVMDCYERGYTILPMPFLYEQITGRVPIEHIELDDWKIVLPITSRSILNLFAPLKRLMDIAFSLLGLALFGVLFPLIALAIKVDSAGPIFFVQERLGKGGKPFKMIKLRSMVTDAERDGPRWAKAGDNRITRVGRWLRKTRLDELPQFINILRGDMSLVGPRAERQFFVDQLSEEIPFYRTRLVVRPGATGWAQIRYPYGNTVEDALMKLQYDLYYIRHQSLSLDLLIIIRTVGKMLSFTGI